MAVQMMDGDWMCSKCNEHNFARRWICFGCGTPKEGKTEVVGQTGVVGDSQKEVPERKEGDWQCLKCNAHNFARRDHCFGCGVPKETQEGSQMLKGDWLCMTCHEHNFARRKTCFGCEAPRISLMGQIPQPIEFFDGDWVCVRCNEHNFARRVVCFGCGTGRLAGAVPPPAAMSYLPDPSLVSHYGHYPDLSASRYVEPFVGGRFSGDWRCPKCNENNFARRLACFGCSAAKPPVPTPGEMAAAAAAASATGLGMGFGWGMGIPPTQPPIHPSYAAAYPHYPPAIQPPPHQPPPHTFEGDWLCPKCNEHNFARRYSCFGCGSTKPSETTSPAVAATTAATAAYDITTTASGDWACHICHEWNSGWRFACASCNTARPWVTAPVATEAPLLMSGDWICSQCQTHNFARRVSCFNCGVAKEVAMGGGDGVETGDSGKGTETSANTQF